MGGSRGQAGFRGVTVTTLRDLSRAHGSQQLALPTPPAPLAYSFFFFLEKPVVLRYNSPIGNAQLDGFQ